jgi:hypothetical protein
MKPYVVTYSIRGTTIAMYRVAADSAADAEARTGTMFWPSHPEYSTFGENEGLEIRAESANA